MEKMKITFIATVFNEEININKFLQSLSNQTMLPDEIVIVDGGSIDKTYDIISAFKFGVPRKKVKILLKKGNRSVGRNFAIKNATCNIIVCSDAGCVLEKDYIKQIVQGLSDSNVDVVAGYSKGLPKSIFEICLVPYVLVMPDQVNADNFLPATRSIAFRKEIWRLAGGFDESLSLNEDYAFAKQLKKINAQIIFEKKAIVCWIPRSTLIQAFWMFLNFARGDSEARIFRPKVVLIFLRYFFGIVVLIWNAKLFLLLLIVYIGWSIAKNYKYIRQAQAIYILPAIQLVSDMAVMMGTILGIKKYGI